MLNDPPREPSAPPIGAAPPVHPGALYVEASRSRVGFIETTSEERTMAMLCHLLALFTFFIGPLIIWLVKRRESPFVDHHGRESLSWCFTVFVYMIVLVVLAVITQVLTVLICVAAPFFCLVVAAASALSIADVVLKIIHCIKASNGEWSCYPMSIRVFGRVTFLERPPTPLH